MATVKVGTQSNRILAVENARHILKDIIKLMQVQEQKQKFFLETPFPPGNNWDTGYGQEIDDGIQNLLDDVSHVADPGSALKFYPWKLETKEDGRLRLIKIEYLGGVENPYILSFLNEDGDTVSCMHPFLAGDILQLVLPELDPAVDMEIEVDGVPAKLSIESSNLSAIIETTDPAIETIGYILLKERDASHAT